MKIFIDADGSPVVDITTNIATEYNIELIIVKNYAHDIYNDYATIISVDIGKDSADQFIVNHAQENDLVITQDYGLAALLLSKQVKVINQNGLIYNNDNIDSLLNRRFLNAKARSQNKRHSNIKKRSSLDDENFSKTLNSIILNEIRNRYLPKGIFTVTRRCKCSGCIGLSGTQMEEFYGLSLGWIDLQSCS